MEALWVWELEGWAVAVLVEKQSGDLWWWTRKAKPQCHKERDS